MMQLIENDYLWKTLVMELPSHAPEPDCARVKITQPQGYVQQLWVEDLDIESGKVNISMLYPLIDDGRYDPSHGTWNGAWLMGEYEFKAALFRDKKQIARDTLTLDPSTFFPSDNRYTIAVDARTQVIECAPRQSLYQNEDQTTFIIRIRQHRLTKCHVEVDVTRREGAARLAGPWRYSLTHSFQEQTFSTCGWEGDEYWIRVRMLRDGEPVGPYCVRKFWKENLPEPEPPEYLELNGYPEVMVDDYSFEQAEGIHFVPDTLDKSGGPLVTFTEPHEEEFMTLESLSWNEEEKRYEGLYRNEHGRFERADSHESRAHLKMLLVSEDGRFWEKPKLGLVDYDGSKDNNILRDDRDHRTAEYLEREHDIEHAQFRFYDPDKDGPVNIENVFLASGKRWFPFECKSLKRDADIQTAARAEAGELKDLRGDGLGVMGAEDGEKGDGEEFRPRPGEHWPFEKRGDLYLVLSREPLLYLGIGMDLMHTTESIRCHVEEADRKRLFYYFRPGSPAYPPHGAPCDNMCMCLRCMGVMWTEDGLNWQRNFVIVPDEHDPVGTQFYSMGMLQKFDSKGDAAGRPVLDKCISKINQAFPMRNLYLGSTLLHWGVEQTQAPELIWTRDFRHFKRFGKHRRSMIELGKGGTFDRGQIREKYKYWQFNDEWWYLYTGISTRHNGYGIMAGAPTLEEFREGRDNHADPPYFTTWKGYFADGKETKYLPAIARCKLFRLAHAEPLDTKGYLTTRLIKVDGTALRLNAVTERRGSITVEVEDEKRNMFLEEPFVFQGDEVDFEVADLAGLEGQLIRLHFRLDRAHLYSFQMV